MTTKDIIAIAIHIVLWVIFMAAHECIGEFFGVSGRKFAAGFVIATYALLAKEVAKYFLASFVKLKFPFFDDNRYLRWLIFTGVVILLGIGLFSWYISWEGKTGWVFGAGVFLSVLLFDYGLAKLFADGEPFGKPGAT